MFFLRVPDTDMHPKCYSEALELVVLVPSEPPFACQILQMNTKLDKWKHARTDASLAILGMHLLATTCNIYTPNFHAQKSTNWVGKQL